MAFATGAPDGLAVGMVKFKDLLGRLGARYRTREREHKWPTRIIPWMWFMVDTHEGVARIGKKEVTQGMSRRQAIFRLQPDSTLSARALLSAASLNFVRRVAPGGFCHLRHGGNAVNDSGIMELRRSGGGRAGLQSSIAEDLRNDLVWRRRSLESRP